MEPRTVEEMEAAMRRHYEDQPCIRPATEADLLPGRIVTVFDAGAWQYPGVVVDRDGDMWLIRTPYDGDRGPLRVPLQWDAVNGKYPAIGVYDAENPNTWT